MTSYNANYRFVPEYNCVDYVLVKDDQPVLDMSLYHHPDGPFVGFSIEASAPVSDFLQAATTLMADKTIRTVVYKEEEIETSGIPDISAIPEDFKVIRVTSDLLRVGFMHPEVRPTKDGKTRNNRVGVETRVIEPTALSQFLREMNPTIFQDKEDIEALGWFLNLLREDMAKVAPEGAPRAFEGTGTAMPMSMEVSINNVTVLKDLLYPDGNGSISLTLEGNSLTRGTRKRL